MRAGALLVLLAALSVNPGLADLQDPDGDAELACVDVTSVGATGDARSVSVTIRTSPRGVPPGLVLTGPVPRLCQGGQFALTIDVDGDASAEATVTTVILADDRFETTGPVGTETSLDSAAGAITWRVPLDSLPGSGDLMYLQVATSIDTSRAHLLKPAVLRDVAPDQPVSIPRGAEAAAVIDASGGRVSVEDPASTAFGASLEVPAGALQRATPIGIFTVQNPAPLPGGRMPEYAVSIGPQDIHFDVPAVLNLRFPQDKDPDAVSMIRYEGVWRATESTKGTRGAEVLLLQALLIEAGIHYYWAYMEDYVAPLGGDVIDAEVTVLLVHGFQPKDMGKADLCTIGDASTWARLPDNLVRRKVRTYGFFFNTGENLDAKGRSLGKVVEAILRSHPGTKLKLIAHSQGGVVVRAYLRGQQASSAVHSIALVGSPHHGSRLAAWVPPQISCEGGRQLVVCNNWLEADGLNATDPLPLNSRGTAYHLLAASDDTVVDRDSALAMRCEDAAARFGFEPDGLDEPRCASAYRLQDQGPTYYASCYDFAGNEVWQLPFTDAVPDRFDGVATRKVIARTTHSGDDGIVSISSTSHPSWIPLLSFTKDVIAYWPFEGTTEDMSANGIAGSWTGGATANGRFGQGWNVAQQYYSIGDNPTVQRTYDEITFATWFRLNTWPGGTGDEALIGSGKDSDHRSFLSLFLSNSHGEAIGAYGFNDAGASISTDTYPMAGRLIGQWHHFAATWDGERTKLYVDGQLVRTTTTPRGTLTFSRPLYLNRHDWWDTGSSRLSGVFDDSVIFDRALAGAEVADLASDRNSDGIADFWN